MYPVYEDPSVSAGSYRELAFRHGPTVDSHVKPIAECSTPNTPKQQVCVSPKS